MLYSQAIPAGGVLFMPVAGRLFLLDGTGAAASVKVELLRSNSRVFEADGMTRGLRIFAGAPFDSVRITGAVAAVMRFIVGDEDIQISTSNGNEVAVPAGVKVTNTAAEKVPVEIFAAVNLTASNVGIASPDVLTPVADKIIIAATAVQLVAADAVNTEREVIIKNLYANTCIMRIGDAAADATHGHELAPGESITLNTLDTIYAYNTGAVDEEVSVLVNSRA